MNAPAYDILKRDELGMVWVEAVSRIEMARLRIEQLARTFNNEYVVFDQRFGQIVGRVAGSCADG